MKTTPEALDTLTLTDLGRLTEDDARSFLEALRWPKGPICPHCGALDSATKLPETDDVRAGLHQCNACRGQFTVTVGTIFEDSHIPLHKWVLAFGLMCSSKKGISALQLQRNLGLGSYKSAWFMAHRIRHAMKSGPLGPLLKGTVEADETYVGGKVRHGRGMRHKTPVMALVERGGCVRTRVVADVTGETVTRVLREYVDPSATLMTDGHQSYQAGGQEFQRHSTVNHSACEFARGSAHINTAESFFALLKRGIYGTFHHVSTKHLPKYADEFSFRWDRRKINDGPRTVDALRATEGKRLMYRESKRLTA